MADTFKDLRVTEETKFNSNKPVKLSCFSVSNKHASKRTTPDWGRCVTIQGITSETQVVNPQYKRRPPFTRGVLRVSW